MAEQNHQAYFITGVGTDIGKTYVSCLILKYLNSLGQKTGAFKPIVCGTRNDALNLQKASSSLLTLDEINPIYLKQPLAPLAIKNFKFDQNHLKLIKTSYGKLLNQCQTLIVEGIGGWEVPLSDKLSMSDIAKMLNIPIIVVVDNYLGALNHFILTLKSIKSANLNCIGFIINNSKRFDNKNLAQKTNPQVFKKISLVPCLLEISHQQTKINSLEI